MVKSKPSTKQRKPFFFTNTKAKNEKSLKGGKGVQSVLKRRAIKALKEEVHFLLCKGTKEKHFFRTLGKQLITILGHDALVS